MPEIIIIGIDPSSAKLAATIAPYGREPNVTLRKHTLPRDKPKACVAAYEWVHELVTEFKTPSNEVHLFIELPVLGRGGPGSTIPQAQIGGALFAGAGIAGGHVTPVNNAHAKKATVGKGNANKDDIARWVRESWPLVYKQAGRDQDILDSAMIWMYGRQTVRLRNRIANGRRIEA